MGRKIKDLTGKRFGRLTVINRGPDNRRANKRWLCRCDCGAVKLIAGDSLKNTKSCGCINKERGQAWGKMHSGMIGSRSPNWKGGKIIDGYGYVRIRCEGHPRADKRGHYVPEHILVMEKYLGRYLIPGETVHHKNGIRTDNRIKNLQLMIVNRHPAGQFVEDLIPYWTKMLKLYKPEIVLQN